MEESKITPISKVVKEEDLENYKLINLTLISGKVQKHLILETISRHMKDKKDPVRSQHGFTKAKSCLTNLMTFSNEMTG